MNMATLPLAFVIDDDDIFRFIMKKQLQSQSLAENIITFNNGLDAFNYFDSLEPDATMPDLLFLDINMPVMDGWQFLDAFATISKRFPKKLRIVMVSSSVDERDLSKAAESDLIEEYVVKPMSREKLVQLVDKVSVD